MKNNELIAAIKSELFFELETISHPQLKLKRTGTTLKVYANSEKKHSAEISIIFLSRAPAFYLQCNIFAGTLHQTIASLHISKEKSNLLCDSIYLRSSLGEKNKEFSPDQGGARYFYSGSDLSLIAKDSIARVTEKYLPVISATLNISDNLEEFVTQQFEHFSYPLGILAILESMGKTNSYSEVISSSIKRKKFNKENPEDYISLLHKS